MKKIILFTPFFLVFLFTKAQNWQQVYGKADSLMQKRQFGTAVPLYEQALGLCKENSEDYFKTRNGLSRSMIFVSSKEKAEPFLLETEKVIAKTLDTNNALYATSLHNIGTFYLPELKGNNPILCESYLKKGARIRKSILGNKHQDYAASINVLAVFYVNVGNYNEAEHLYKETLKIRKEIYGVKHQEYAMVLGNLGLLYNNTGNPKAAESIFKEVIEIYKNTIGIKNMTYAQTTSNLGVTYSQMGNYTEAEVYFQEALNIRKEVLGIKHIEYAASVSNLANLYRMMGHYSAAESLQKESLQIRKEVLGKKHPLYAASVSNLANLYISTKNYREAVELFKEAIAIRKETLGEKHNDYAVSLNNLAIVYDKMGYLSASEPIYKEVLKIRRELFGENSVEYLIALANFSIFYRYKGDFNNANLLGEKALKGYEKTIGKEHPNYTQLLEHLAYNSWESNQIRNSAKSYNELKNWALKQPINQFPTLSEQQKEDFYNANIKYYITSYNSFAVETQGVDLGELYNVQLATKALLMQSAQKIKNRIINSGDSILVEKYWKWNKQKQQFLKASEMNIKGKEIDSLHIITEKLEKELSFKSEDFANLTDKKMATWKDIKKALKYNEAAIEIIKVNKKGVENIFTDSLDSKLTNYIFRGFSDTIYYAALIIKANAKKPELVILKNGNDLENKFAKYYKNSVSYKHEDSVSYTQYWQPIADKLKGIKRVYLSPDGVYNQINLNVLMNPKTGKFIIDETEIYNVTNTKELLSFGKKKSNNSKSLLFGYPIYDTEKEYYTAEMIIKKGIINNYLASRAIVDFKDEISLLPGTANEITDINNTFQNTKFTTETFWEKQATEENVKKVNNPRILHIATHGFFIDSKEKSTTINPMLRSGLLLTGVSNYAKAAVKPNTEDGILTALEAANLNLDETDLVVLSACETGLGDVRAGEGVYGLQRAFKVAGAKTIIMSLWKVDDVVTNKLMAAFYQNYILTNNAREAFRLAQTAIKSKYPEPYYWGAFVMVGE